MRFVFIYRYNYDYKTIGKTTVAKLYAKLLTEIGVLPGKCKVQIRTGSELSHEGVSEMEDILADMQKDGGGVFFIDEAYQLNNSEGRRVLDYLLANAEKLSGKYGKIVWILAGYAKDMDDLFKLNPGLASRFPHQMMFEDYTDAELLYILKGIMERGGRDIISGPAPALKKPAATALANTGPNQVGLPQFGLPAQHTDQWGNIWKWDARTYKYVDDYGNEFPIAMYGYAQSALNYMSTIQYPIMNVASRELWYYDNAKKLWTTKMTNITSKFYPGKQPVAEAEYSTKPFVATDEKWLRVAIRRLGRQRGVSGFGNARAVRNLFDLALKRQSSRISALPHIYQEAANKFLFTQEDLLGPKATMESLQRSEAWKNLRDMVDLESVKRTVEELLNVAIANANLEEKEQPLIDLNLNRLFLGNPGTGKSQLLRKP